MADWVNEETKNKTYSHIPGLQQWIIRKLNKLNITRPTPVQFACIPPALAGRDVIGGAKTGSGKTMAFVLPILNKLSEDPFGIFALVLTPTRELAFQIGDQFRAVGNIDLKVTVIIGGEDRIVQCRNLNNKPHIVVSTPGRLYDLLLGEPEFSLKRIKFLVLDEADRLLDGRFSEQLNHILSNVAPQRQTLLFSATITEQIQEMESLASKEVFRWESSGEQGESTVAQLQELYCLVNPKVRDAALVAYLLQWRQDNPKSLAIIFMETCANVEAFGRTLLEFNHPGLNCVTLHSFKPQKERLLSLSLFKSSQVKLLIATDLASRGLDIPLVSLVVNHQLPNNPKTYLHRVGRTARAGRSGTALSIITPEDQNLLLSLEARNPQKLKETKVDALIVRRIMKQVNVTKREQEIKLEDSGFHEKKIINKRKELINQGLDPDEECAKLQHRIKLGQEKRRRRFLKEHGATHDDISSENIEENSASNSKKIEKAVLKATKAKLLKETKRLSKSGQNNFEVSNADLNPLSRNKNLKIKSSKKIKLK